MRHKVWIFILLFGLSGPVLARQNYSEELYDFGFRLGTGFLSGVANAAHPMVDVGTDFYFLSPNFRMVFGVTFIYPNSSVTPFTVSGLQYLGVEYQFPFWKNVALLGLKATKTYLKNAAAGFGSNRSIAGYVGYKHPISKTKDYYIQLGIARSPFKSTVSTLPVSTNSFFLRTGVEFYF